MNKYKVFEQISALAEKALIDEVSATPKPGLVDSENSGAHSDMDINTFKKSAQALKPYFYRFVIYGYETAAFGENKIFPEARNIGMEAEKAMFDATGGINTHKGMIFSAGLICIAVGRILALNKSIDVENICYTVSLISKGVCQSDYSIEKDESLMTNGEKLYRKYGIKGIRGEAESGFATIKKYSYPFMKKCFCNGMTENESLVRTLIYMMSVVEDTNVISRGGKDIADYVKKRAESLYDADFDEIKEFDRELIQKNLSPGGCADLLAITWFIYNLEKI